MHAAVRKLIRTWPADIKKELGVVLMRLQQGETIGMPDVRRMASVARGVSEIRIQDNTGSLPDVLRGSENARSCGFPCF